jgi:AcrR family transcriptional regulator
VTGAEDGRRGRNAAATRDAILRSAQVAFTRAGYDGVGVREIAQGAGVTAMLVNRYFGSKERLFAEAVEATFASPALLTDDVTSLSRDVAKALTSSDGRAINGFLLMLRSVSNPRAVEILRDAIDRHFQRRLADLLPGARAGERAALFLSVIAGFQLMHNVVGSQALAHADERLERLLHLLAESDD